ncbi:MAG: biotin--[acetyl-CoA-carboxylase] ligase [Lachnospiraceae bacterium]|nr:biotin--[acetyl-CoA-carboxylase] ligase [Lachnospiraceae bacterium]
MSVKEEIITLLEQNRGTYISGGKIAKDLGISRTAVWKAIQKLQDEGFMVDAITNKGYMLMEDTDVLSASGIEAYLLPETKVKLEVYKTIDSTNLELKRRATENEGLVIASSEQTSGMGRLGRSFSSPSDTGIYFSILLKPNIDNSEVTLLTTIAALAVCEAIEKLSDKEPAIKWVNDVFIDGKKVNGTLTQASFSVENLAPEYVIVGIGINVYEPVGGFPEEIKDIAGAVFDTRKGNIKNRLLAEVLNRYFYYYTHFEDKEFIGEYKKRSFVIGKTVSVVTPKDTRKALVLDIDSHCRLMVRYEDGTEDTISTGEISIRL